MTAWIDHLVVPSSRAPASAPFPVAPTDIPGAVAALRRGIADGTLHHHDRTPTVDVVRAWAGGADLDAQREACGCAT